MPDASLSKLKEERANDAESGDVRSQVTAPNMLNVGLQHLHKSPR